MPPRGPTVKAVRSATLTLGAAGAGSASTCTDLSRPPTRSETPVPDSCSDRLVRACLGLFPVESRAACAPRGVAALCGDASASLPLLAPRSSGASLRPEVERC
eukprot:1261701-Rhodomonas_salina.3